MTRSARINAARRVVERWSPNDVACEDSGGDTITLSTVFRSKRQTEPWRVASSGHPTASGSFGEEAYTFRDAFWQVALDLGVDVRQLDPGGTYMLELCHTPNRVVVRHDRPRLVLHGARDLSGQELSADDLARAARAAHCEVVREFPITSIAECLRAAEMLDPLQ